MSSRAFLRLALSVTALVLGVGCAVDEPEEDALEDVAAIGDVLSMVRCPSDGSDPGCPAGSFRVGCASHLVEIATEQEILANQVCARNSIRFELNGAPIGRMQTAVFDAYAWRSNGRILAYSVHLSDVDHLNDWVLGVDHITSSPSWFDCSQNLGGPWNFHTMTVPADVALPEAWRGLSRRFFGTCGRVRDGLPDSVVRRSVSIFDESLDRFSGVYEIVVEGAGPRLGETLRVYGDFDVVPALLE